jgi:anaerobic magnesium-protoporphyrin IX monomethyl ester cyclase
MEMKQEVNILLISPSTMPLNQQETLLSHKDKNLRPTFATPTGLIELASYARNKFHFVNFELLDLARALHHFYLNIDQKGKATNFEKYINDKLNGVKNIPDVIGISILFSSAYMSSLKIAQLIKKKWPNTVLVFGGGHVTFYHDIVFKDSQFVDYVFAGEAEISFSKFLEKVYNSIFNLQKIDISNIAGIYDRQKVENEISKGISTAVFGEILINLDEIGLPAFDLLDIEAYKSYSNSFKNGAIGVMFDRGCPFNCTYCASMIIHGSKIRAKSNQRIIEDLLHLRESCGFSNIVIWDDLLAARKSKFINLAKKINDEKINQGLIFSMPSGLSVRIMDKKLLEAVCSLGFDYVRIMIESGSKFAQEHIVKKRVDLCKARKLISHARTLGVKVETNILFGFPKETKQHMQETIDYINTIDVDWIQVFALLPLPGTEAYNEFVKMGHIDPTRIDWNHCGYGSREFDTKEITAKELTDLVYDVNIMTNFFGNRNMLNYRYERAIKYFSDMVLWKYDFHIPALYQRAVAYKFIGKQEKAEKDMVEAVNQIKKNSIALNLWNRYGSLMPLLFEYLEPDHHLSILKNIPSVDAGFKFSSQFMCQKPSE